MKRLLLPVGGFALLAVAVLSIAGSINVTSLLGNPTAEAQPGLSMDAMAIDMDPANAPANTNSTIGTFQSCARINENNALDADEDVTADTLSVNTVADNLPLATEMVAFSWTMSYDESRFTVQTESVLHMITNNGGSILDTSDLVPDADLNNFWTGAALDTGVNTEDSGDGILSSFTVSSDGVAGPYTETWVLQGNVHIDNTATAYAPLANFDGGVALDTACPLPPADLAVQSVDPVNVALTQQNTGTVFTAVVSGVIVNNGPATADWTATFALSVPSDCTATPSGGPTQTGTALANGATANVSKDFSVICTDPSSHVIDGSIAVDTTPPGATTDPDPNNNGPTDAPGNDSINIIATANLNVVSPTVDAPASANNGSPFNVTVSADISNGGPATTDVDVTLDLTPTPAGCTRSPDNSQLQTLPGLTNGTSAGVSATWIITCTTDGLKPFTGTISAVPTTLHVVDPTPATDSATDNTDVTTPVVTADMKATSATVDAPANASGGVAFNVSASGIIHNNGPDDADADLSWTLNLPPDCTTSTANPQTDNVVGPTVSVDTAVSAPAPFAVTCTQPSFHDFTVTLTVAAVGATDPTPGNNTTTSATDTTGVTVNADPSVTLVTVNAPPTASSNAAFNVDVVTDLANTGFTPVNVDVSTTLSLGAGAIAAGCSATPNTPQTENDVSFTTSAQVTETFSVTCTGTGTADFTGSATVTLDQLHVADGNAGNNTGQGTDSTIIEAVELFADMKATEAMASAPDNATGGIAFNLTASGTIHNNGPDLAGADLSWTLNLPSDCTTSTANPQTGDVASATPSVPTPVSAPAPFSVTCTNPSFHDFTVTLTVAAVGATDPTPGNNSTTSATDTTAVTVSADPSVTGVTVNAPTTASSNAAFNVDVVTDLANSGFTPVFVDLSTTLTLGAGALAAGCTATPNTPQTEDNVSLGATGQVTETFSVTCTGTGTADFTGSATVTLDQTHVADSNAGNNTGEGTDSTTIEAVPLVTDMKAETAIADAPADASAGIAFDVTASGIIHNNGPDVAAADLAWTLNLPPDCTTDTANPQTSSQSAVSVSVDTPVSPPDAFSVTCTEPSAHSFDVTLEVAANGASDPTPGNNSVTSANDMTAVTADADPSVVDVVVTAPATAAPNTPFNVDVVVDLANNFGVTPVNVDVAIDLTLNAGAIAAGCAETPNTPQDVNDFSLGATAQITKTWSVTCTNEGTADFTGSGAVTIDELHVVDAVLENNSDLGNASTTIDAGVVTADLKVTTVTVSAPDDAVAGTAFDVSVTAALHNNGPETPIDASVSVDLSLPPDCTRTPANAIVVSAPDLEMSIATPLTPVVWSVTCGDPSEHIFTGSATASITTPDVTDSNPANNTGAGADNTAVTSTADLSASANVVAPATAFTGTAFDVSVEATVNNAGPEDTTADVIADLLAPPGCTRDPDNSQAQATLITNGGTAMITFTWSITCTTTGIKTFQGGVLATPTTLHVSDPTPATATDSADTDVQAPPVTADLKMLSAAVDSPAAASVGVAFDVTASGVVHNNGPDIIDADVSFTLNLPADCTTSTANPQIATLSDVEVSVETNVAPALAFSVTCTQPSFHDFTVAAAIAAVDGADPTPGNNSANSAPDTTPVTGIADLKVNTVTLVVPPTADAGVDFTATITANIHNNGPIGPVDGSVNLTLALLTGCTSPDNSVTRLFFALPMSTSVDVTANITVNCADAGQHLFRGSVDGINVTTVHVVDNNPGNNTGTSPEQTTNVMAAAEADLKVTGVDVAVPAEVDAGVPFAVDVSATVHNNGPTTPIDATVFVDLMVPDDCTTTPSGTDVPANGLAMSVPAVVATVTFDVICSEPSEHTFEALVEAVIMTPDVTDPNPDNTLTGTAMTAVIASADPSITLVTVDAPATAATGETFTVDVVVDLANSGFSPVNVDVSATFTLGLGAIAAGCTANPNAPQTEEDFSLGAAGQVTFSWDVTCTTAGTADFSATATVTLDQLHVVDANPDNNTATGTAATTIEEDQQDNDPGLVFGSGEIKNGTGRDQKKITSKGFAGFTEQMGLFGDWDVKFNNVAGNSLDGKRFESTEITSLQFMETGMGSETARLAEFTANGELDGVDGYSIRVCVADRGGFFSSDDSTRIQLFDPNGVLVYDSFASGDFPSQDNTGEGACANRHTLDKGNYFVIPFD